MFGGGRRITHVTRSTGTVNPMTDPWNFAGSVTQLDSRAGVVTLVDESTFAISGNAGDIAAGAAQGLFVRDTRILSKLEVLVDGVRTEPLAAITLRSRDTSPIEVSPLAPLITALPATEPTRTAPDPVVICASPETRFTCTSPTPVVRCTGPAWSIWISPTPVV